MTQPSSTYVTTLSEEAGKKLLKELIDRGFTITTPQYTRFSAKKEKLICTLYLSGKLVIQGKGGLEFIEFYLEPEILQTFQFTQPLADLDVTPRIGIDESGKGDFFGPLCIAGVYVSSDQFHKLASLGVKDSKTIKDSTIRGLAKKIKADYAHHVIKISPIKYNQLYESFKNLNRLLAWGHVATIEQLVQQFDCQNVILDQFAHESVILQELKKKNLSLQLTQRHRAEEDLVVAAASILAREAFIDMLDQLSKEFGIVLPKGCSTAVLLAAKEIFKRSGIEGLKKVCKMHFKTSSLVTNAHEQSDLFEK